MATAPARPPVQSDHELASALQLIEGVRSGQQAGIQALGSAQDTNIQNIYGTLQGGLQRGVADTEGIYNRGGQNIQNAYALGGQQAGAFASGGASRINDTATRLGLDPAALSEVQGKLALQAGEFANRNQQSSMQQRGTMAQQGAGMTAISRMAVDAARQAEAQGRSDLSKKILAEVAKANTSAAQQKVGATNQASSRAAQKSAEAARAANSAAADNIREQRAMQREARSAQRAQKSANPLDDALKMMRLKMMESGMDPNSVKNQISGLNLDRLLGARDDQNSETADAVWQDIYDRFPHHGSRTIPLLQDAIAAGAKAKDSSGQTARKHIRDNSDGLDVQVVLDQLVRLEQAAKHHG